MRILGAIFFFILGTLVTGIVIHLLWLLYFEISGTGDNKVIGFSIPTEVIIYIFTIFIFSIAGGVFSTLIWLKKSKK